MDQCHDDQDLVWLMVPQGPNELIIGAAIEI